MSEYRPISTQQPADDGPSRDLAFTPVPGRRRHDGWTAERQIAFVEKLADCGSISAACKHVGMSRESVRRLRRHPRGEGFRDACDAALDVCFADLEEAAFDRAVRGVARPVYYKGEQVGEWRHHDERLTMFLLRFRRRHRFGPEADTLPRFKEGVSGLDPDQTLRFDPEDWLAGKVEACEFASEPLPDEGEPWFGPEPSGR